jgi:putative transposase
MGPHLAVADGALGFWQAVEEVCRRPVASAAGCTKPQLLNKLPQQSKAKPSLQEVWMAETKSLASPAQRPCL